MIGAPGRDVDWAAARLGWRVRDRALLETALTHRSHGQRHNERLEFLGDAVLSFVVAEHLYRAFPEHAEGDLSRFRASLVSGESLADLAEELAVGDHLRLGPGELRSGGFRRRSILADAFEAVLGALYLDGGFEAVRPALDRLIEPRLERLRAAPPDKDPKTRLQEFLQARALPLPHYTVESVTGEPHAQTFTVRCAVDGEAATAEGSGASRRRAEQQAAERLLAQLEAHAR